MGYLFLAMAIAGELIGTTYLKVAALAMITIGVVVLSLYGAPANNRIGNNPIEKGLIK